MNEVDEAWESHGLHRELKTACEQIQLPELSSSAIRSGEHWTKIGRIDFRQGGSFINSLDDEHIPAVLDLLAAFVKLESPNKKHTDWKKEKAVFTAVLSMFINCALKCRGGMGYWLL